MNTLTNKKVKEILRLTKLGVSQRKISDLTGAARVTIARYQGEMDDSKKLKCGCGRDYHHRGRCEFRRKEKEEA